MTVELREWELDNPCARGTNKFATARCSINPLKFKKEGRESGRDNERHYI
jgi:hypothetical protein